MRLLHVYAGNLYGGIERMLVTLARHRAAAPECEQIFGLCFAGRLSRELELAGAAVQALGEARFARPWSVLAARRRFGRLLRERAIDVVVCHSAWPHSVFAPAAASAGVPVVFAAHDVPTGSHWLERLAGRTPPSLVIANSRFTARHVPRLFPEVRVEVLHPPVELSGLPDSATARCEVRKELGTPSDAVVVVMAARLERWKGQALLLKALAKLRTDVPWECWIAGGVQRPVEQDYWDELLRVVRVSPTLVGRVRMLGQRDDVPQLFAAADVHCQPNTSPEPFGVAFVEALAAGLPVVTTSLGAAEEIVEDESCGIIVAEPDEGSISLALGRLLDDPVCRARMSDAARARAAVLSDPDTAVARLAQLAAGSARTRRLDRSFA